MEVMSWSTTFTRHNHRPYVKDEESKNTSRLINYKKMMWSTEINDQREISQRTIFTWKSRPLKCEYLGHWKGWSHSMTLRQVWNFQMQGEDYIRYFETIVLGFKSSKKKIKKKKKVVPVWGWTGNWQAYVLAEVVWGWYCGGLCEKSQTLRRLSGNCVWEPFL